MEMESLPSSCSRSVATSSFPSSAEGRFKEDFRAAGRGRGVLSESSGPEEVTDTEEAEAEAKE